MGQRTATVTPAEQAWPAAYRPRAAIEEGAATLTTAELAREFGLTRRALRFYEDRGFLSPRRNGAIRAYSRTDRDRIACILQAKKLGFTLREIASLLRQGTTETGFDSLYLSRQQCTDQIRMLERQKRDIESALAELRRVYSSHYLRDLGEGECKAG